MRTPHLGKVIDQLLRENAADGDLLDLYARECDEPAFAEIVRRHGPMVWSVCNRVLRDVQDCEDAFQAVFLLLVRKAGSIGRPELLANWLHGVAYRTALEARRARRKRVAKEASAPLRTESHRDGGVEFRDVLDKELARLPDTYRAVLVLSYLEGRTRSEVARQLRLAEGTVASRLSRGRAILAKRLARHGLASGAVAALVVETSSAAVPRALLDATVAMAGLPTKGEVVSSQVIFLMQKVLNAMFATKLKVTAAVLLAVTLLGTGLAAGVLTHESQAAGQGKVEPKSDPAEPQAGDVKADQPAPQRADLFDLLDELNAARFDEQFLHKRLQVSGILKGVSRMEDAKEFRPAGSYYLVVVRSVGGVKQNVTRGWGHFQFALSSRKELAKLEINKPVTIEGRCLGFSPKPGMEEYDGVITFDGCKIVPPEK